MKIWNWLKSIFKKEKKESRWLGDEFLDKYEY